MTAKYTAGSWGVNPDRPTEVRQCDENGNAPDLLETVKEIAAMLESHPEAKEGNSKVHYCACVARAAIRKATRV